MSPAALAAPSAPSGITTGTDPSLPTGQGTPGPLLHPATDSNAPPTPAQPSQPTTAPISMEEFGQRIKAKHPEYADLDNSVLAAKVLAKYPQYHDMVRPNTAREEIDARINAPSATPDAAGTWRGTIERFGQGAAQGITAPILHPVKTAESMGQTLLAGNANPDVPGIGITAMTGNPQIDAQNEQAKEDARADVQQQSDQMKQNPAGALGQLAGGIALSHVPEAAMAVPGEVAGALAGTGEGISSLAHGITDTVTGASKAVRTAGEKAIDTQTKAEQTNAKNLADYQDKVAGAGKTDEEKLADAKAKIAADQQANPQANPPTDQEALKNANTISEMAGQNRIADEDEGITREEYQAKAKQAFADNVQAAEDMNSQDGKLARQEIQLRLRVARRAQDIARNAKSLIDGQYAKVRTAIGGKQVTLQPLLDAVDLAKTKFKGSQENIKIFSDILSHANDVGDLDSQRQEIIDSRKMPSSQNSAKPAGGYDDLTPHWQSVVDEIVKQNQGIRAAGMEPMDRGGTPTIAFQHLRGYSSELGRAIQGLRESQGPGDVIDALKTAKATADAMAEKMAKDANVRNTYLKANKNWGIYKDVFKDPNGPSGSGSPVAKSMNAEDAHNATQPFLSDKPEVANRARKLLVGSPDSGPYYDANAGKLVDKLRDVVNKRANLPKVNITEPPAAAADAKPLDIQKIKANAVMATADRLKYLDKWQARAILGAAGGAFAHFLGASGEHSVLGGLLTGMAPSIIGQLVDMKTFSEWAAKSTPHDLNMLQNLEGSDKIRIRNGVTGLISNLAQAGEQVKVSPAVRQFIGTENTMKIAKAIAGGEAGAAGASAGKEAVQNKTDQKAEKDSSTITTPKTGQKLKIGDTISHQGQTGKVTGTDSAGKLIIDWKGKGNK
jgi:hypothetical protein